LKIEILKPQESFGKGESRCAMYEGNNCRYLV